MGVQIIWDSSGGIGFEEWESTLLGFFVRYSSLSLVTCRVSIIALAPPTSIASEDQLSKPRESEDPLSIPLERCVANSAKLRLTNYPNFEAYRRTNCCRCTKHKHKHKFNQIRHNFCPSHIIPGLSSSCQSD